MERKNNNGMGQRRQSSVCGEELFEFVDYTSVSKFERLSTAIEEIIHSWGTEDSSFGIFSDDKIETDTSALRHGRKQAAEYSTHEIMVVGDDAFKLTYHYCHPSSSSLRSVEPLAYPDFYLFGARPETQDRGLHRWTGLDRLFVLSPVIPQTSSSSLKAKLRLSAPVLDINQAKTLISACAIAFHNTNCSVPVFVPVGHHHNKTYIGYRLEPNSSNSGSRSLCDMEFRYNTYYCPSSKYCKLDDILYMFNERLNQLSEDIGK